MKLIESDQNSKRPGEPQPKTKFGSLENEQSFAKLSIEGADKLDLDNYGGKPTKVLGITWDCESDQLIFDLKFQGWIGYAGTHVPMSVHKLGLIKPRQT